MTQGYSQLIGLPLMRGEREGLAAALAKAGLPTEDVHEPGPLFWRFENAQMPVGFGGLEIAGDQALLRSVVTLPPMRRRGIGRAIVAALEVEGRVRGCRRMWLLTPSTGLFEQLGYSRCERSTVPKALQACAPFKKWAESAAVTMSKSLD